MFKKMKSKKGFTLVELVVVVAILGILAGLAIPRFMEASQAARGARIVSDMRTIESAAMLYEVKSGALPENLAALVTGYTDPVTGTTHKFLAVAPIPPTGACLIESSGYKIDNQQTTAYTWTGTEAQLNSVNLTTMLTKVTGD